MLKAAIPSQMNSDESSRKLDLNAGLEGFVRLPFCEKNPMMFVAKKEDRICNPVVLRIKLEVVSRPGVLFSDCNATRHDAKASDLPDVVRFDTVRRRIILTFPNFSVTITKQKYLYLHRFLLI